MSILRRERSWVDLWRTGMCLLIVVVFGVGGWVSRNALAEEDGERRPATRSTRRSRSIRAKTANASESGTAGINEKLDRVIEQQQEIMKQLDKMLEELKIVKIRATVR